MSKEDLSPEDQAYYKRFEVKPLRVLLYFLAVVYLVFVFAIGGSQFSGGFFSGAVGSFILIQGIDLSQKIDRHWRAPDSCERLTDDIFGVAVTSDS